MDLWALALIKYLKLIEILTVQQKGFIAQCPGRQAGSGGAGYRGVKDVEGSVDSHCSHYCIISARGTLNTSV